MRRLGVDLNVQFLGENGLQGGALHRVLWELFGGYFWQLPHARAIRESEAQRLVD